jgi:hypothetical protein
MKNPATNPTASEVSPASHTADIKDGVSFAEDGLKRDTATKTPRHQGTKQTSPF